MKVESDSLMAVKLINSGSTPINMHRSLFVAIQYWLHKDGSVTISHTLWEGNQVANWLSKLGGNLTLGVHRLSNPPSAIRSLLFNDLSGVAFPRGFTM